MRRCSKPRCHDPATVVLGYNYADQVAFLDDAPEGGALSPHVYALCSECADNLTLPRGWALEDRRVRPSLFVELEPMYLGAPVSGN